MAAGQSNPTWLLRSGLKRWVLRAKPGPQSELRGIAGLDLAAAGIPSERELIGRYCQFAGRQDEAHVLDHWPFYLACNYFRLAAILHGIAHRVAQGIASHPQAIETARMAGRVAELGWQLARGA